MQLQTLGGLTLQGSSFRRPKPLLLLTYLALEGAKDRHHLAELFWSDAAEPLGSLRVALAQLRAAAPGTLEDGKAGLAAKVEADALELLRALDTNDPAKATELYRGAFLAGFYLAGLGSELEEWVYSTREFLGGRVRDAWLTLAERDAAVGDFREAARRAEMALDLVGAPPPEPEGLARLYRLLVAGNSPKVRALQREARGYGIELGFTRDEARREFRLSAGPDTDGKPILHNLPLRPTSFVGRDPELIELAKLLADPHTRLITLVGVGGVGKTRLAIEAAHGEVQGERFTGGVYFVPLDALSDPGLIPSEIAGVVGVSLSGSEKSLAELTQALAGKRLLLVLDNFEHLMAGVHILSTLLAACPTLKLLVTSRESLNLEGEHLFQVTGLPLPEKALIPAEAHYQDAVQLFTQRAKRVKLDFTVGEEALPHVLTICRRLEGSPLGIELAAAWVNLIPLAEIAAEAERGADVLSARAHGVTDRHRSLRATFEHSWRLLTPREQETLGRLSVFVGGFTREAASLVAGASIPLLVSLVDKSLLRVLEGGRYDRHPLIYGYTREKLAGHPEAEAAARAAHAGYFLKLAEEAEPRLRGIEQVAWLARLEAEHDNLRAALRWAQERTDVQAGLRLAAALYPFWEFQNHLHEGRRWLEALLVERAEVPLTVQAKALSGAGNLARLQGDLPQAEAFHRESLRLARESEDTPRTSVALNNLALVARDQGEVQTALALYEESLGLKRSLGDKRGTAITLNNMAQLALDGREYSRAKRLFEESLSLFRALGNARGAATVLNNLGIVAERGGDYAAAHGLYEESLTAWRSLGDKLGVAMALTNLGSVLERVGEYALAQVQLRESLVIKREIGAKHGVVHSLEGLAALAAAQEQPERAVCLWGAAEALREALRAPLPADERADYDRDLAAVRARLGDARFKAVWAEGCKLTLEELVSRELSAPQAGDVPKDY